MSDILNEKKNQKQKLDLAPTTSLTPIHVWPREAQDFTPWLAENLEMLGNAINLDLEYKAREVATGDFFCDILAVEIGSGRSVIIENQYGKTDHNHLGQILTYAGGHDAKILIWIAPEIREEHRQAIDYLNKATKEDFDYYLIELRVFKIENSKASVEFRPVAMPNSWSKNIIKSHNISSEANSLRGSAYQSFWQPITDTLRQEYRFTNSQAKRTQSWISFPSGVTGIKIGAAFAGRNRLQVELYIDLGDQILNKEVFDVLRDSAQEIQKSFKEELNWERLDHRRASRVSLVMPNMTIDQAMVDAKKVQGWVIKNILEFKNAFGPYLRGAVEQAEGQYQKD